MTDAERAIVEKLADIWNLFQELPVEHPMEQREFCSGIHALQNQVAARPAFRELRQGG